MNTILFTLSILAATLPCYSMGVPLFPQNQNAEACHANPVLGVVCTVSGLVVQTNVELI